jgi:hypothetical protein
LLVSADSLAQGAEESKAAASIFESKAATRLVWRMSLPSRVGQKELACLELGCEVLQEGTLKTANTTAAGD